MAYVTVGVRELKAQLSHFLRQVQDGTTVVITERGKPVGQIVPVGMSVEERVRQLADKGVVAWSGRKPGPVVPVARGDETRTVSDILLENRE